MQPFFTLFVLSIPLLSCASGNEVVQCETLFGQPSSNTGLSTAECNGECPCGDTPFSAPTYSQEDISNLEEAVLLNPPDPLTEDPYSTATQSTPTEDGGVCAIQGELSGYVLEDYKSASLAHESGAKITHAGPCGQCSSLQNLSIYIRNPDLTDPVRECGIKGMLEGDDANIQCLMDIGFDLPCAQIWFFNTRHTRQVCLEECMSALDAPHHMLDGSLNDCIQCDEDESGPVFKAVAGRTRRNSGLPSGLCRPCGSVYPVVHNSY